MRFKTTLFNIVTCLALIINPTLESYALDARVNRGETVEDTIPPAPAATHRTGPLQPTPKQSPSKWRKYTLPTLAIVGIGIGALLSVFAASKNGSTPSTTVPPTTPTDIPSDKPGSIAPISSPLPLATITEPQLELGGLHAGPFYTQYVTGYNFLITDCNQALATALPQDDATWDTLVGFLCYYRVRIGTMTRPQFIEHLALLNPDLKAQFGGPQGHGSAFFILKNFIGKMCESDAEQLKTGFNHLQALAKNPNIETIPTEVKQDLASILKDHSDRILATTLETVKQYQQVFKALQAEYQKFSYFYELQYGIQAIKQSKFAGIFALLKSMNDDKRLDSLIKDLKYLGEELHKPILNAKERHELHQSLYDNLSDNIQFICEATWKTEKRNTAVVLQPLSELIGNLEKMLQITKPSFVISEILKKIEESEKLVDTKTSSSSFVPTVDSVHSTLENTVIKLLDDNLPIINTSMTLNNFWEASMKISFLLTELQDKSLLHWIPFQTKIEALSSPARANARKELETFFTDLEAVKNKDMPQIQSIWESIQKDKTDNPNYIPMGGHLFTLHNIINGKSITIEHVQAVQNLLLTEVKAAIQKSSSKAETQ